MQNGTRNGQMEDQTIGCICEVEKMGNDENKKDRSMEVEDFLKIVKDFFKLQNQYNHYRIEEYKEWNEKDCDYPICVDYTVQLCDEVSPEYCDGFREEWL